MLERYLKISQLLIIIFSLCYIIISLFHPQPIDVNTTVQAVMRPNFFQLGMGHILFGFDHLIFLLLMLLLFWHHTAKLIKAITAFTIGHSVALGLAVYGFLNIPSKPVEIAIILSLVILSIELLHKHKSWIFNYTFAVAALFGVVHGLGLADGLSSHNADTVALLQFNIGIEAGQILFIIIVSFLIWMIQRHQIFKADFSG